MLKALKLAQAGRYSVTLAVKDQGDVAEDAPDGWVEGIANAHEVDRYNELVRPAALAAAVPAFMRNPVLSFGHGIEGNPTNGTLPAGTVLKMWQEADGSTHFRAAWAPTEDAQLVRKLYKTKHMRAFSVQFICNDSEPPTPADLTKFPGMRIAITKLDLLEIACAVVPVNAGSLATSAKSLGLKPVPTLTKEKTMGALNPDQLKQVGELETHYNSMAEKMGTVAEALTDLMTNGANEEDHAPRAAKLMESHKAMGADHAALGDVCKALATGLGVKAEGEGETAPPKDGEEAPPQDGEATPEQKKEQEKAFVAAMEKSLGVKA